MKDSELTGSKQIKLLISSWMQYKLCNIIHTFNIAIILNVLFHVGF
jgi:hypothetical protein